MNKAYDLSPILWRVVPLYKECFIKGFQLQALENAMSWVRVNKKGKKKNRKKKKMEKEDVCALTENDKYII